MTADAERFIKDAFVKLGLSMRTYYKLLKVARTIADLDWTPTHKAQTPGGTIEVYHLAEALRYRALDSFYRMAGEDK